MNSQKVPKGKHIYFAIDSDVLRAFVELDKELEKNKNPDFSKSKIQQLRDHHRYLKSILDCVKKDIYRLLLVDTVYYENKHDKRRVEFMKKYCYAPPAVDKRTQLEKRNKIFDLANKYCKSYYVLDKKTGKKIKCDPPMQIKYIAPMDAYAPSNDAFIMAEATIENSCVLTFNEKDFTMIKGHKERGNVRSQGIVTINYRSKYYEIDKSKKFGNQISYLIPKPISVKCLGPTVISKNPESFVASMSDDSTKVKCDKIL